MASPIRQPSQALVRAAWLHAEQAAATAIGLGATAEQVRQHCQQLIDQLPDAWQRQVVNQLALARRRTRGTANDPTGPAIDGAATTSAPSDAERETRGAANDPARNPDSGTVAAAWNLP